MTGGKTPKKVEAIEESESGEEEEQDVEEEGLAAAAEVSDQEDVEGDDEDFSWYVDKDMKD